MKQRGKSWSLQRKAGCCVLGMLLMGGQGCQWLTPTPHYTFRPEFAPPLMTVAPLNVPCDVKAPRTVPFEGQQRCVVLLEVDYINMVTRHKGLCLASGGGALACQAVTP